MYQPLSYPWGENYPSSIEFLGFLLSACSMVVIPGYAIYYLFFLKNTSLNGRTLKEVLFLIIFIKKMYIFFYLLLKKHSKHKLNFFIFLFY